MKKKILKFLGIVVLFLIILFACLFGYVRWNQMNIVQAIESLTKMNTANIKCNVQRSYNGDNINFIYNFNYNKHFSDDKYNDVIATDGTFGFEVDSMEMGFYAPMKLVFGDDLNFFLEISEEYEDILGIKGGENIHGTLTSLRANLEMPYKYDDLVNLKNTMESPLKDYFKKNKDKFTFYRSESQGITTGVIGRLAINLEQEDIDGLYNVFKDNLDETTLETYKINKIFKYLQENYIGATLYIDIYGDTVNKITLNGQNDSITIEIGNVDNANTITIPDKDYVELVDYLKDGAVDILSLFGFEIETEMTKVDYLRESFANFANYMIACIDYTEDNNFDNADICINNMKAVITDMKSKIFSNSDTSVNTVTYNKYVEFFSELANYCKLYKESFEDPTVDMTKYLQESVSKLNELSSELSIDISGVFDDSSSNVDSIENDENISDVIENTEVLIEESSSQDINEEDIE